MLRTSWLSSSTCTSLKTSAQISYTADINHAKYIPHSIPSLYMASAKGKLGSSMSLPRITPSSVGFSWSIPGLGALFLQASESLQGPSRRWSAFAPTWRPKPWPRRGVAWAPPTGHTTRPPQPSKRGSLIATLPGEGSSSGREFCTLG